MRPYSSSHHAAVAFDPSRPLKKSSFSWIPAFAGMTAGENVPFFVIPAKAGIQGAGCWGLFQRASKSFPDAWFYRFRGLGA